MRIGLDATPLIRPYGGIARYVTELAVALAELGYEDEIHLLTDQTDCHYDARLRRSNIVIERPAARFGGKWWSVALPWELRRRKIDVFHGTDFSVPYLPVTPSVLTLHDLSPWKEEAIRPPGSERVRARTPKLLGLASVILTPTQAITDEVRESFGVPSSKILAIHHAPTSAISIGRRNAAGQGSSYLLYLGSGEPRKNLPRLVDSWRLARRDCSGLGLILAGIGEVEPPAEEGLRVLSQVSDDEASALLSGATAFIYPSLYEGFGLPVVEAMQLGVPVIASRDPALVEVADGATVQVDATSTASMAEAITNLIQSPFQQQRLRELGLKRAATLTWNTTAEKTRAAYERALRR